jgi:hypothetical protein
MSDDLVIVLKGRDEDFCVSHNVLLYHVMGNKLLSCNNIVFELFAIHKHTVEEI